MKFPNIQRCATAGREAKTPRSARLDQTAALALAVATLLCAGCSTYRSNPGLPARPLSFLVVGDWGDPTVPDLRNQRAVAQAMAKVADKFPVSFIVSTGDNFYAPKGKENPKAAPPIRDLFESVYTNSSLKKLPWYLTLGNHDHDDYDYKQEIAYTTNHNNHGQRWKLPGNYYSITNSQASALLVFLDTTPITSPATNVFLYPEAQLTWLRNTLAVSTNQWKLVFGHHPIVYMDEPGGPVGCRPVAGDLQSAEKILLEQRVIAYFCGHVHSLEYLLDSRQGKQLHCFISAGGGSGISHVSCPKTDDNNWSIWDHGFLRVSIYPEKMVVTFWNSAGNNFATVVVKK